MPRQLIGMIIIVEVLVVAIVLWDFRFGASHNELPATPTLIAVSPTATPTQIVTATSTSAVVSSGLIPELPLTLLSFFDPLPNDAPPADYAVNKDLVDLGRMLYFDPRLSINQKVSCNTCHPLDRYGADGLPQSIGHTGKPVKRNAQSVFNAALHIAQFWDGRSPTVEAQAQLPILSPGEMGMPDPAYVEQVLRSIPGYVGLFRAAFPADPQPITHQNVGLAIGAFERQLLLPSRFDRFLEGDYTQLNGDEQRGLVTFITTGCPTCHVGATVGGLMYKKLGEIKPYPVADQGRYDITKVDADRQVFKVPSLRNVAETAPYLHDGSIATLEAMVRLMAQHQLGRELSDQQVAAIVTFLKTLTGDIPKDLIFQPPLPPSGSDTPLPQVVQ